MTAFHEAGHAVASKALGFSIPTWITIVRDGDALGRCQTDAWTRWSADELIRGRELAGRVAVLFLSGHAAGQRCRGDGLITAETMLALPLEVKATQDADPTHDLTRADRALRICEPLEHDRGRWLAVCWNRAVQLMQREWGAVEAVAAALLERKRVEGAEVVALLATVTAPRPNEPFR